MDVLRAREIFREQPPVLASPQITGGEFSFEIRGHPSEVYDVQYSTNLSDWTISSTVTNLLGAVPFTDQLTPDHTNRFYRAILK